MRKLTILILIIVLIFSLTSCKEVDTYRYEKVEAVVTETSHKSYWIQLMPVGKTMMQIHHPAQYNVYFEYEGMKLHIDDKQIYEEVVNNNLTTYTICKVTTIYTDGTSDTRLECLKCQ